MSFPEKFRLDGRTALVTGAAKGIGQGCTLALAEAGADLVLNDRPGDAALDDTAKKVRALGRTCQVIEADVFSPAGCEELVTRATEAAGGIDILVSNPAYGLRCGFLDFPDDEFDKVVDATFKSGFRLSRAVARHMVERGKGGKILFISSVQAEMPYAKSAPYGAAKAALNHFTQTAAVELFDHRINVNAIEPGWIDTPNERARFPGGTIPEADSQALPWKRLGTPDDIGRAAVFLVSDAADYVTGAILPVDGGFRLKDYRWEQSDLPEREA